MISNNLGWGSSAGIMAGAAVLVVIVGILLTLICVGLYVFYSLMLYQFAKKHGIAHAWIAWIPVISHYVIGEGAGPMRLLGRYEIRQTGILLPLFPIVVSGSSNLLDGFAAIPIVGVVFGILSVVVNVSGSIASVLFLCLVLYRVYSRYLPKNTTLVFSILSIFGVTIPFFLASILNKPQISEGYDFTV